MVATAEPLDRREVERLVREVLRQRLDRANQPPSVRGQHGRSRSDGPNPLVVNVSARHVHVTQADLEVLFGPGARLTKAKDLYQQGEFGGSHLVRPVGPGKGLIPTCESSGPREITRR